MILAGVAWLLMRVMKLLKQRLELFMATRLCQFVPAK
jgi:hypothetical protein